MSLKDRHWSYIKMWSDELCEFCKSWGDVDGQSLTQRIQDPRTAGRAEAEKMLGLSNLSGPSEVKKSEDSDCNTE